MPRAVVISDEERERYVLAEEYWHARLRLSGQSQHQFVESHRDAIDTDMSRHRRDSPAALASH